jgi:hypothetical protein
MDERANGLGRGLWTSLGKTRQEVPYTSPVEEGKEADAFAEDALPQASSERWGSVWLDGNNEK